MIEYLDGMFGNADLYYISGLCIVHDIPAGGTGYAYTDIGYIEQEASKCIYVIDKHNILK